MSALAYTQADVERIAHQLGGAKRRGRGYSCLCPAHDDRNPSLDLDLGERGRLLSICRAGCEQGKLWAALRRHGVLLNGDARGAEPKRKAHKKVVAVCSYTDENGQVLYEKVRYQPKDFRQRRPDGNGGYIWSLGDTRRVLYHFPDVIAATEVVIVEGEKDSDRLRSLGFTATTNVEGASKDTQKPKWREEYSAALAGKNLIFIPDNDAAGRAHMENAARSCIAAGAASARIVLLEGLPEKGDVSDWLGAGHSADELKALTAEAPEWVPQEQPEDEANAEATDDSLGAKFDAAIEELNGRHFILWMAGRSLIGSRLYDDALDRERLVFSKKEDIKLRYNHRHYVVGHTLKGNPVWKDLGTAWIEDPRRRSYEGVTLDPKEQAPANIYNLWLGWGVDPKAGDWPLLRQHMQEVICSGNEEHYRYLIGWCAHCVQHPEKQAEVAVVMRGLKGTGKGTLAQVMMRIFRHHSLHITHSRHLVGNFNAHLIDALFLFLDEAFWGGDKQGEGVLKALVTERMVQIEPKGVDSFPAANRLKIMMASNNDWVVPATADERRFFMPSVSDARKGDRAYFNALYKAIEGGETSAFLHSLLSYDLSGFSIRDVPHTEELNKQKLVGTDSATAFWYDCLRQGSIVGLGDSEWPEDVVTQLLRSVMLMPSLGC